MVRNSFKGFTLIELSIVLIIIGMLFVGGIESGVYFMRQNNIRATIAKLNTIQNALDIYVIENGKLPCPSGLKLNTGTALSSCDATNIVNGLYVTTSSGVARGGIPYETLNLTSDISHDAWGNKIIYSVSIKANNDIKSMDNLSYDGISIYNNKYNSSDQTENLITDKAVYSLLSSGENELGGVVFKSASDTSTDGISYDETINSASDNSTNKNVYFINSENGDDILIYKTRMQIITNINLEDLNCYITDAVISNLEDSNSISDNLSFTIPSNNYMNYNEELKSGNEEYIVKCFKYGRLGIFKNAE